MCNQAQYFVLFVDLLGERTRLRVRRRFELGTRTLVKVDEAGRLEPVSNEFRGDDAVV